MTTDERHVIDLSYTTGTQDAGNTFDGDAVPTASDLWETARRVHDDALAEGWNASVALACAHAWVDGYQDAARRSVHALAYAAGKEAAWDEFLPSDGMPSLATLATNAQSTCGYDATTASEFARGWLDEAQRMMARHMQTFAR